MGRAPNGYKARLLADPDSDFAITIISVEEQMRGWLAQIKRSNDALRQVVPYDRLGALVAFWNLFRILPFDEEAAHEFQLLKRQARIGTQDLKIAAITIIRGATLLTANVRDFERVPGLALADWLD